MFIRHYLVNIRKAAKINQADLAEMVHISRRRIIAIERGNAQMRPGELEIIAKAIGLNEWKARQFEKDYLARVAAGTRSK